MICPCPKCSAKAQLDHTLVPEEGVEAVCTECKTRFWIDHESFAGRALRKTGGIYCSKCGNGLGSSINCPSCGVLYPEYYVVHSSKSDHDRARKLREKSVAFVGDVSTSWESPLAPTRAVGEKQSPLLMKMAGIALLVVLAGGGFFAYKHYTKMQDYRHNYVRALFVIKSGTDQSFAVCDKSVARIAASQTADLRISPEDEKQLNAVRANADKLMKSIGEPPEKFNNANVKLVNLYNLYDKIHSQAVAPGSSASSFTDSTNKLKGDFTKGVQELKTSLPQDLAEDIQESKAKYKALQSL